MNLLLDTHVLLWWTLREGKLTKPQTEALERAEADEIRLHISAISLWETAKLVELGRIVLNVSPDVFFDEIESAAQIQILPISARVALESTRLGSDFHKDPADQIIVATARVHGLRLVTCDERILRSRLVSVV